MSEDEAVKQYLAEISKFATLSSDEESRLFEAYLEGQRAERQLVESKLLLVVSIAERYISSGMPMVDLIQEGNVGLMNAIRKFAKSPSGSFSHYAAEMIEKAIEAGVAEYRRDRSE